MSGPTLGFRVPDRLAGRYALGEPLGAGGMGAVYRARDELLDREVAVKLVVDDGSLGADFARACVQEARAAAGVRHPGIVQVYDGGVDAGFGYVVMERVGGPTLREAMNARSPLPVGEAVEIAAGLADALEAAHTAGVVHCDVKPANVVLPPGGAPTLVDFGIARLAATTRTLDAGGLRGSAQYVSPEQVTGGEIDGRSDVYALGVVTYEMLTGRPPFDGGNAAAVAARRLVAWPQPPRELNPGIPPGLERVVLTALARDPGQRYAAGALRDALRAALDEPTVPLETAPLPRFAPPDPDAASIARGTAPPDADVASTARGGAPAPGAGAAARAHGRSTWMTGGLVLAALVILLTAWSLFGPAAGTGAAVPNLVGLRLAELPPALRRAGLVAGEASTRPAEAGLVSTILEQDPPAGAPARAGDAVRVVVGVAR